VYDMGVILANYVIETMTRKYGEEGKLPSFKAKWRLMSQCLRAIRDISGLPDTVIELDTVYPSIAENDNVCIPMTRGTFETLCGNQRAQFEEMMLAASEVAKSGNAWPSSPSNTFKGVEIVGGGSRVPWVQQSIEKVFKPADVETILRKTVDGTAAGGAGAAYYAAGNRWVLEVTPALDSPLLLSPTKLASCRTVEENFSTVEGAELHRFTRRNELESFILTMQSAVTGVNKDVIAPKKAEMDCLLEEADSWLLNSDPCETSATEYESRYIALNSALRSLCPAYFQKLEGDSLRQEQEIEAAAKETHSKRGPVEDHDFRKLPNSQRIEKAKRNKEEGNDIFKNGGVVELAVQHYLKALTHTSKVFDVTPSEKEEVDLINMSIHLNLAQCYIKMGTDVTYRKAVFSCNSALEIQPNNPKALYRRAVASVALKDFSSASKDLSLAASIASDSEIVKLQKVVERGIAAEKEKEQKMFAKMFQK